ncbi:pentatricopeptide repeat-containing protein At3g12770-like [Diospyros lotus]|uniref:pentatricopeptide repeat-containing protein At3g12770-like n=1 Tax=Diospyros lotus TaxID=55363 RepID=UPI002255C6D0|nr:pentatricopeptide repeat-containing protein At3g12770-like [Diospyros lotus]
MFAASFRTLLRKLDTILCVPVPFPFRLNDHSLTFSCLLNSCSSLSDLERIHALILVNGSHRNLLLSTKLITLASSLSPSMDYARKLFDLLPDRDVFVWNTVIRGYANLGPCEDAIDLFRDMHQAGMLPDSYTFPAVVRSCAVLAALREGRQVHCNVVKTGFNLDVFT